MADVIVDACGARDSHHRPATAFPNMGQRDSRSRVSDLLVNERLGISCSVVGQ